MSNRAPRTTRILRLCQAIVIGLIESVRHAIEESRQLGLATDPPDSLPVPTQQRVDAAYVVRKRCHAERHRAGGKPEEQAWVKACRDADAELVAALRERGNLGDDHQAMLVEQEGSVALPQDSGTPRMKRAPRGT